MAKPSVRSFHTLRRRFVAGALGYAMRPRVPVALVITVLCLLVLGAPAAPTASAAQAGDLDLSFAQGGGLETNFREYDEGEAVAIQADGKIVVAGWTHTPADGDAGDFAVARYLPTGVPDTSFYPVGNGKRTIDFGGYEYANAVAIQADGRIVVAGSSDGDVAVARLNTNGGLDTTFGQGGKTVTSFASGESSSATAVAIQPNDGKIVVAGWNYICDCGFFGDGPNRNFALARYNATNGSLDKSFDGDGKVVTGFGGQEEAHAVAVRNGKIVAAGESSEDDGPSEFALARYNMSDGRLDGTFDGDGKVETAISGSEVVANGVAIQANGRIVAAGQITTDGDRDFELMRYTTIGELDDSFDGNGKQATDFGGLDQAHAVTIQGDGKIVAVGGAQIVGDNDFALARYHPNGSLDGAFGTDGKVTTYWSCGSAEYAHAVAIQPSDGKIVAAGSTSYGLTPLNFAVARYYGAAS
jgi:uncharacterized delta-60 repeat protein